MTRRREWMLLLVMIVVFIMIRALRLSYGFHFLHDQALFSFNALELWRDKAFTLIGPPTSWHIDGRYIFQGSAIYYLWMIFLAISGFDPYLATWVYMLSASIMLIPLYFGVKSLVNFYGALIMCLFYVLYSTSIAATSELWNPHFQFSLLPLLVYSLSRYQASKQLTWMAITGTLTGFLLQFHYQFILVVIGLGFWSIFQRRYQTVVMYLLGVFVGFSPLILFELRNEWYNLRTVFLLFANRSEVFAGQSGLPYHYLLSLIPFVLILCLALFKHSLRRWMVVAVGIILVLLVPRTLNRLRAVEQNLSWDYRDEVKVYQIIREQRLGDYNVTSFYQGIATPQRYLHLLDGVELPTDYYHNRYLFVIYPDETYGVNSAYEMNSFKPSKKIGEWTINTTYNLYLLERR